MVAAAANQTATRPEPDHQILPEGSLAITDGLVDHLAHPQLALQPGDRRGVVGVGPAGQERHAGDEVGEHDLLDPCLAQRRQDLFDVPEEDAVRADDQDALVLQREPVRVEQVGGPVEGDDGLAGPRPALDHQHAVLRRPDDLVLFRLDRGDDVAERPGAASLERRQQRRVAP